MTTIWHIDLTYHHVSLQFYCLSLLCYPLLLFILSVCFLLSCPRDRSRLVCYWKTTTSCFDSFLFSISFSWCFEIIILSIYWTELIGHERQLESRRFYCCITVILLLACISRYVGWGCVTGVAGCWRKAPSPHLSEFLFGCYDVVYGHCLAINSFCRACANKIFAPANFHPAWLRLWADSCFTPLGTW